MILQDVNFSGVKVPKKPECRVAKDVNMPMGTPHGHRPQPVRAERVEVSAKQRKGTAVFHQEEYRMGSHPMVMPLGFWACTLYTMCPFARARLQTHMLTIATQGHILYFLIAAAALASPLETVESAKDT